MSYTKGWKILREAEKQLGFPLLFSRSGGSDGGSSKLTPKGEEFLKRYVKMEEDLKKRENGCLNFISGEKYKNRVN